MADKDHLILTAIGPDQVGLVEKIAEFISRHGCNIEDSKMAVFCGEFAVIVLISGDGVNLVKDRPRLSRNRNRNRSGDFDQDAGRREPRRELFSPINLRRRAWIIPASFTRSARSLSSVGINIESMETKTYAAPISGTPIFQLEAEIAVPARTNINQLRARFAEIQQRRKHRHRFDRGEIN